MFEAPVTIIPTRTLLAARAVEAALLIRQKGKTYPDAVREVMNSVNIKDMVSGQWMDADTIIKPKQHLRVALDIDISFEEASFIKEKFIADYSIRELTLIAEKKELEINTNIDIQAFESVDQIVSSQIVNIDSDVYNKNTLLAIYNSL